MSRSALLLPVLAVALAAGCGGSKTVTVTQTVTTTHTVTATTPSANAAACTGSDLHGSFDVVNGSAGAGQISYLLTLTNSSATACFVTGLPVVQLLDSAGNPLPTHVSPSHPGEGTAAKITLPPGGIASAQARFSPDVNGVGDAQSGRCQPPAASMRVTASGGGSLEVPVSPPTSVCERGSLRFDLLLNAS